MNADLHTPTGGWGGADSGSQGRPAAPPPRK